MIGVSTSNWIGTLKVGKSPSSGTIGGRFEASGSFFARERENVGQKGFDALVHRASPLCGLGGSLARYPRWRSPWPRTGDW